MFDGSPQITDEEFREEYQRIQKESPKELNDWMQVTSQMRDPSQGSQAKVAYEIGRYLKQLSRLTKHRDFSLVCQYMRQRGITDPNSFSVEEYYAHENFLEWGGDSIK